MPPDGVYSGRGVKKQLKLDSLHELVSLSYSGGDRDKVIRIMMRWTSERLDGQEPITIFTIVDNQERGSAGITRWRPAVGNSESEWTDPPMVTSPLDDFKELSGLCQGANRQILAGEAPSGPSVRELIGVADESQVIVFPLHTGERSWGVLGLGLRPGHELDGETQHCIQQFADLAALCLQNSELYEVQARQTRELQHEDELRRSYISLITHEFRTPLASLKTSFELIQEAEEIRGLDELYQRLLTNVNRSVSILGRLTDDLCEVANLSSGGVALNKSLTAPEDILTPVVEMARPLSQLKHQRLEVEVWPDLPDLMADAYRLEQVLTNMIANAIKYTPAGGTIRTTVSQDNGSIKFAVSDNGRGIPKEDLSQVFEPFYRVPHRPGDPSVPGTGLGLVLARSLVELHGGEIRAESELGAGSTFYFTIPVEPKG